MKGLTKEQVKKLREDLEHERIHGEFICNDCGKKLIGMDEVSNHVSQFRHHMFGKEGTNLCLGIGAL